MASVTLQFKTTIELDQDETKALRNLLGRMSRLDYEKYAGTESGKHIASIYSALYDAMKAYD